jgi:pimeloyl-ACP methyl ester carboxylesterase
MTQEPTVADFIEPININGLQGRMLRMPPPRGRNRQILFVYGHHSSLERWWGLVQNLNRYGGVTMPDLPGFGGMESLYSIGQPATIDKLADYLAAFIKFRYRSGKIVIAGMSLGFVIVTRMLQRYPHLAKRVELLVSLAGFAHKDDFTFSKSRRTAYYLGSRLFSVPPMTQFFRYVILQPFILRLAYGRTRNAKEKFKGAAKEQLRELMDFEIVLWHSNDVKTYMKTTSEFLRLDNCNKRIDLPVSHVAISADRYFDNHVVEQHYRVIFNDFHLLATLDLANHAPSVLADAKAAAPYVPLKLQRALNRLK